MTFLATQHDPDLNEEFETLLGLQYAESKDHVGILKTIYNTLDSIGGEKKEGRLKLLGHTTDNAPVNKLVASKLSTELERYIRWICVSTMPELLF